MDGKKTQHAEWNLIKIEKNFQWDLCRVKEHALGAQNIFCLKS